MSWEPLLLQVVLIALNAIFASAEIAVISTNETKLKKMAQDGDKRAGRLVNLTEQPARFLATIQVAITLAGMLSSAGNEKGTFDEEQVEMIQNVFAFDDTSVEEVCTHRVDVVMLDMDDDMTVWEETIQNSRFTYYPISGEDDDDIIGVLDTKDFFRLADRSRESVMANAVDKPYFVPETVKADVLLTNMKRERKYFAILLDEYGGLSGIITLRDIMQLLVGDFYEEEEEVEEAEIVRTGDMEWKVAGSADLEEVAEALAVTLPVEEYETFGGYICGVLGHVPDDGTSFLVDTEEIQIQVHNVDNHRILGTTVLVKPKKEENTETE